MARKKLRTIGKRVLRELESKLPESILKSYEEVFKIDLKALTRERNTKDKIYSLHPLKHPNEIWKNKNNFDKVKINFL